MVHCWVWKRDAWCWFYILQEGGWIFVLQNLQMYGSVIGWRIQRWGSWTGLEKNLAFWRLISDSRHGMFCDPINDVSGWTTILVWYRDRSYLLNWLLWSLGLNLRGNLYLTWFFVQIMREKKGQKSNPSSSYHGGVMWYRSEITLPLFRLEKIKIETVCWVLFEFAAARLYVHSRPLLHLKAYFQCSR